MKKRIGIIGSGDAISDKVWAIAQSIGRSIADSGCVLICGGRGGVMEAACKGASDNSGLCLGLLPSLDASAANPYVDVALTTGLGLARNALVVSCSDAVIAVAGAYGTLSEIGLALSYKKPVIAVSDSGGVAGSIMQRFQDLKNELLYSVPSDEAVDFALQLIRDAP